MLSTVRVRACRRCGGQLFRERDVFGDTLACIQCGATYSVLAAITHKPVSRKLPPATNKNWYLKPVLMGAPLRL